MKLALSILIAAALGNVALTAHAQVCPFDDGGSTLQNDGLVLTRYALGLRGAPMVANTSFAAADAATIESNIACPACGLRVTDDRDGLNNPIFTATDATIISRKLAGFEGASLTNGLALGSGTRNTPAAVQSFLLAGCGATGGTVTSVTAGAGLTGGTITASGTLAADTNYLQRRVSTACAAGRYITAIAADGTPTCGLPPAGGSGTVTSVGAGTGLVANGANVVGGAIVSNGLMELANGYILPQACTMGQVPKSAGGGSWVCAEDNAGTTVTNAFTQGGNAFGAPGVMGTTDGQPLTVGVGAGNGLRVIPSFVNSAPNIILGSGLNTISTASSVVGTTVGGGQLNSANGAFATISGGNSNTAAGNWGTVAGGTGNSAAGAYSFAAGRQAKAAGQGSFVWADSTPLDYNAGAGNGPSNANSFNVRATGGVNFVTTVDGSGVATRGLSVDSAGITRANLLQVTGPLTVGGGTSTANLSVTGAADAATMNVQGNTLTGSLNVNTQSTTGALKVGSVGAVIAGLQAGRTSVHPPGSVTIGITPDQTGCNRSNEFEVSCYVDRYFAFPNAFNAGQVPQVILTLNYANATIGTINLSAAVIDVTNAGVTYRVTQHFWPQTRIGTASGGFYPLRVATSQIVGWISTYFVDWIAIAQ